MAKSVASERYPGAEVVQAFVYKKRFYIFEFFSGKKSHDSPYVCVSMVNGKARPISPLEDLDGFFYDMEHNQLEV
jgi:hypothetical protein